jgi:hypothetical protein
MTAEEFLLEHYINSGIGIEKAMIGFAKIKCKELLEIVVEKAYAQVEYDCAAIDKGSILNAIDLETFCS